MDKHYTDIFVPHKKLRKGYYLTSGLLAILWYLDLNKLNIPLPTKVLQPTFLDKLLLTSITLLILGSYSMYRLFKIYENETTIKVEEETQKLKAKIIELELIIEQSNQVNEPLPKRNYGIV